MTNLQDLTISEKILLSELIEHKFYSNIYNIEDDNNDDQSKKENIIILNIIKKLELEKFLPIEICKDIN